MLERGSRPGFEAKGHVHCSPGLFAHNYAPREGGRGGGAGMHFVSCVLQYEIKKNN